MIYIILFLETIILFYYKILFFIASIKFLLNFLIKLIYYFNFINLIF